jgi:HK97 family phage prohead protease
MRTNLSQRKTIEHRSFRIPELRVVDEDSDAPKIVGYAAVFNRLSEKLGYFREKISPGAFRNSLKNADVRAVWNHDPNYVLGRTTSGTLRLEEDQIGLRMEADPPETQWAKDFLVSIRRGDVNQMSFSFDTIRDEWTSNEDATIRTLLEVELYDVSPVTFPAYPDTSVVARNSPIIPNLVSYKTELAYMRYRLGIADRICRRSRLISLSFS